MGAEVVYWGREAGGRSGDRELKAKGRALSASITLSSKAGPGVLARGALRSGKGGKWGVQPQGGSASHYHTVPHSISHRRGTC